MYTEYYRLPETQYFHSSAPSNQSLNQSGTQSAIQSVSQPPSLSVRHQVSQSVCCLGRVEAHRRGLCLSREAPDTTVASPGLLQWLSTQKPTHWDNGTSSEWGCMAELRLPTCTLQEWTHPPHTFTVPHHSHPHHLLGTLKCTASTHPALKCSKRRCLPVLLTQEGSWEILCSENI